VQIRSLNWRNDAMIRRRKLISERYLVLGSFHKMTKWGNHIVDERSFNLYLPCFSSFFWTSNFDSLHSNTFQVYYLHSKYPIYVVLSSNLISVCKQRVMTENSELITYTYLKALIFKYLTCITTTQSFWGTLLYYWFYAKSIRVFLFFQILAED